MAKNNWKREYGAGEEAEVLQGIGNALDVSVTESDRRWYFEISLTDNDKANIESAVLAMGAGYPTPEKAKREAIKALKKLDRIFFKATEKLGVLN